MISLLFKKASNIDAENFLAIPQWHEIVSCFEPIQSNKHPYTVYNLMDLGKHIFASTDLNFNQFLELKPNRAREWINRTWGCTKGWFWKEGHHLRWVQLMVSRFSMLSQESDEYVLVWKDFPMFYWCDRLWLCARKKPIKAAMIMFGLDHRVTRSLENTRSRLSCVSACSRRVWDASARCICVFSLTCSHTQ